ncbi:MAG: Tetraselmis viridis virus [Bacteroidota bacterium]|jgi:hypothetical protein
MTIKEIQNPNSVKLKATKFVCDENMKDIPEPYPAKHSFLVFSGSSRSGKSSLITSLLTNSKMYKKCFHSVIVVMPIHSFLSLAHNPFLCLDDNELYDDLEFETLETIYHKIQSNRDEDLDTLLYIDDMMSDLKNRNISKLLSLIVNNRRHLRCSIWIASQVYNAIPLVLRKSINYLILFKPKNKKEIKSVQEEMTTLDKDQFNEVLKYVFNEKYNYLIIDRDLDKLYKMFNEIVVV